MRVAFAGTPQFAAAALRAILQAGFAVPLVLTQPDRAAGRGMALQPSPVKRLALEHRVAVHQPLSLRDEANYRPLAAAAPDVLVVAAYGLILPQAVLDIPNRGCINIHASLLPRWRGAAPIQRALLAGDRETGATIMRMDAGLDTGPMLRAKALPIAADDTAGSLHDKLAELGAQLIVATLHDVESGTLRAVPQPEQGATYAAKIAKAEAAIDWRRAARELERAVRAFDPVPGAVAMLQSTPVKVWRAHVVADASGAPGEVLRSGAEGIVVACGEASLCLTELQKPGGKRLAAGDFVRGFPLPPGSRFQTPDD
jgi:methionyl-tRNA formyltransferase